MKISARNQLKGEIANIQEGAVNAVVTISNKFTSIKANITMDAVRDLGLSTGKEAVAIIKASAVMFATEKIGNISARNQIEGTVVEVQEGAVNGHVKIELPCGCTVKGSITNEAIKELGIEVGGQAVAIFKSTDVMVGVE